MEAALEKVRSEFGREYDLRITGERLQTPGKLKIHVRELGVDMRLTPSFDRGQAEALLRSAVADLDAATPAPRPTTIDLHPSWPAYRLPATSRLARTLQEAASRAFGRAVPLAVVGPSNVGNFLSELGIEATTGFGVTCRNVHASDEAIEVASVAPVYEAYDQTLLSLLSSTNC